MSFQIPEEVQKLKTQLIEEFAEDLVPVRCNNCGNQTVMNSMYAKLVKNGIASCGKCRKN